MIIGFQQNQRMKHKISLHKIAEKKNGRPLENGSISTNKSPNSLMLIAGPCSAESEVQVRKTAEAISLSGVDVSYFRAGLWKPRSQPGTFEGAGYKGIDWLKAVKRDFNLPIITEVANPQHVEMVLKNGIDAVWIGARTTVNPFYVQEIANALKGVDIPVFVKNPVNPDLELWMGAIERIEKAIQAEVFPLHRGFNMTGNSRFRNRPVWQIPIELHTRRPELTMICDPSHIAGDRKYIYEVSQKAINLNYRGLMIETHIDPPNALSDAAQQISPALLSDVLKRIQLRSTTEIKPEDSPKLSKFRERIDELDFQLLDLLKKRMDVSSEIGAWKQNNKVSILQPERWSAILKRANDYAAEIGLSSEFIDQLFKAIHDESIDRQTAADVGKLINEYGRE